MKDSVHKADRKLKEGRIPVPGHENCTQHVGGICGDVLVYVTRNDPARLDQIIQELATSDQRAKR